LRQQRGLEHSTATASMDSLGAVAIGKVDSALDVDPGTGRQQR